MLSVVILTYNSEETIADCIESLKPLNAEIIIIDSGSKDRTIEIAERLGAKIFKREFKNFSDQRNFAVDKTHGEWVLFIDSDEIAPRDFCKEVLNTIQNYDKYSNIGGYFIKRKTFFLKKDWQMTDRVQRLFYKDKFIKWEGVIHETPKINGEYGQIICPVLHFTHRDLSSMVEKTNAWSGYEAELRFKSSHPKMSTWRFFRVMITAFLNSYVKEKGYKNGTAGVIESIFQAFSMFITYAKLWELQEKK